MAVDLEDKKRHEQESLERVAIAYGQANGATVEDVSVLKKARVAGFTDYPGFNCSLTIQKQQPAIKVKGHAGIGKLN